MARLTKKEPGIYSPLIVARFAECVRTGEAAPSHATLARELNVSTTLVQREINCLLDIGELEARIDRDCIFRRCYRIVSLGLETAGFATGIPLDQAPEPLTPERLLAVIATYAERGARAPGMTELAREVRTHAARVRALVRALWARGDIDLRSYGGTSTAYRIVATGMTTAGFDAARPMERPKQCEHHAVAQANAQARAARKRRDCLTCQKPFTSEGPHNRMCYGCRSTAEPEQVYRVVAL